MSGLAVMLRSSVLWGGYHVWQRNRDAFLRGWKVEVGGVIIEPFILLVAMGFGLGAYIEDIGDMSYAEFLAPGLVASYAMFHATFDSTYGAYLRMESHHIYEAMLYTPISPADIVVGEVMWSATRAVVSSTAILLVAASFGLVSSPLAILAIPCAYLLGVTTPAPAMILPSPAPTIGPVYTLYTLFVLPLFYVRGVFFPAVLLPIGVQIFSWALPLTPGASLMRGLVTGDTTWFMVLWALELVAVAAVALWLASMLMTRRLIK